ncbi:MAG: copper homeostasis membrane protein CopD [Brevundimonas sp.]|uniref:copper homeostasis membrane protein CopD n=1 Tax=Brevundimonas sp. TaxID=1871086 RepID=UPI0027374D57|nr:copper homeostasis membrane protein CopD [Brevundimonas sp.]MDP3404452.1 copper homeostasis membrane protein CopD [Brevundimonas sp.]
MTLASVEVLIRLAQFGFGLVLFGLPAFAVYRRRAWNAAGRTGAFFKVTLIASALGLLIGASAATLALTVNMYGTLADALDVEALWSVLTGLQVGVALGARLVLTAAFLFVLLIMPDRTTTRLALTLVGGVIVAGFAWSGHGAATEGVWALTHLISDVLHLLAAAIWIGALVALTGALARASAPEDADMARDDLQAFSTLGTLAVLVIIVTGLINSAILVGVDRIGQMTSDPYGQILIAKVALFGAMLGLAAANRFVLVPRLERQDIASVSALSSLKIIVGVETALGVLVLLAVAVMGRIAPMSGG